MRLSAEQRQVLELLAGSPRGYTKGRLLADGFTVDMLADLVREGLATVQRENHEGGRANNQDRALPHHRRRAGRSRRRRRIDFGEHDRPVLASGRSPSNDSDPHCAWNGKARGDEGWRKDDRGRPGQDLRRWGGRLLRIVGKASVKSREGPTTIKSWCSLLLDARWFGIPLYLPPHANQRASHRGNPRNGSFPALSAAFVRRDIR
jgi:hypothetical protein